MRYQKSYRKVKSKIQEQILKAAFRFLAILVCSWVTKQLLITLTITIMTEENARNLINAFTLTVPNLIFGELGLTALSLFLVFTWYALED